MEEGAELVQAEDELIAALQRELDSLKKLNPFQVLGIGYETGDQEVRASFGELTKRYHPDRYARYQSGEARELASEIFILIRDAYRKLGNAEARARTLAVLENERVGRERISQPRPAASPPPAPAKSPPPVPPAQPPRPKEGLRARDLFQRPGKSGPRPMPSPTPAPTTAKPELGHSGADKLLDAGKYDEALALYRLSAKRNPNDAKARAGIELAEGLRAMAQRDRLEAAQRFEAVLELDPTNERAARELAEMRRQATNDRKGLLARLLGKKE
jgi:curved DNA-binding protein CbpA